MGDLTVNIQEQLKDTYDILGQIGEGGGGLVYKAYHIRLQKEVVIKKMHMKSGNELKNRQEADILKNLRHSYLPQVLDFIEAGNDVYTVIDYIPGESFQQLLDRQVKFPRSKVIKYARQLCEALVYLHGQNIPILHGDIKPANIMLTPSDNVCLIDFNISGYFEQNEIMAIGYSKGYAAPEQKALVLEIQRRLQQSALLDGFHKEPAARDAETVGLENNTVFPEDGNGETETLFLNTGKETETETLLLDAGKGTETETLLLDAGKGTETETLFLDAERGTETLLLDAGKGTETLPLDAGKETETLLLDQGKGTETWRPQGSGRKEQGAAFPDITMKGVFADHPEYRIDARSDIYSLGATLYHLLSGRRPEDGRPNLTYGQLSELSSDAFAYILTTAMEYKKENRFQSAEKMLEALNQIAKLDGRYKKLLFRQRMELLGSFTVFLLGIVTVFAGLRMERTEQENRYEMYISNMEAAIAAYDGDAFEENYMACMETDPSDPRAYYENAVWLYRNRDYEGCREYIENWLEGYHPEDPVASANLYLLLGNCYYEEGDVQNAILMLEDALGHDGQNRAIYRDLAIAYAGAGRTEEAQGILEAAIENGLEEDQIYLVQGEIAGSQKDVDAAREKFKKCLEITKDDVIRIRAYVFYSDLDKNDTEALLDSAQMLEKGIRELPLGSTGILYERLAQMYINLEANTNDLQYSEKAIQTFQDIIDNGAASYQTYINLTILYEQTGDFGKAHEAIERAIDLFGDNYVTYKRLAFLEADEQANKDISERDYHAFGQYYEKTLELYQGVGTEDPEIPLLEKIYAELVKANWL